MQNPFYSVTPRPQRAAKGTWQLHSFQEMTVRFNVIIAAVSYHYQDWCGPCALQCSEPRPVHATFRLEQVGVLLRPQPRPVSVPDLSSAPQLSYRYRALCRPVAEAKPSSAPQLSG